MPVHTMYLGRRRPGRRRYPATCGPSQVWYARFMGDKVKREDRQTRKYLRITLITAGVSLLLYFVVPNPWNQYFLVLAIAFAIMALGVLATR